MSDLLFPPWVRVSTSSPKAVSNTAASRSIFSGAARTIDRTGHRWRFAFGTQNANAAESAALRAFLSGLKGQANRVWMSVPGYVQRGSFPATELLTNNTFANGTTGWTAHNSAIAVADRVMRSTASGASSAHGILNGAATTQYAPYVYRTNCKSAYAVSTDYLMRSLIIDPVSGNVEGYPSLGVPGFSKVSATALSTSVQLYSYTAGNDVAGRYADIDYTSYSRCFLVDNGANLLTYSDQFDNAAWTKSNSTVTANAATAPDGLSTADELVETTANASHFAIHSLTVSASALDYSFTVCVKRGPSVLRDHAWIYIDDGVTSTYAMFNVQSGVAGAIVTGAGFSNTRTHIRSLGNGWYACTLTTRKTGSSTALGAAVGLSTDGTTLAYAGSTSASHYVWRATLAQSSVPTRLVQSTSAAVAATAQTGNALYVKGLPASTSGLFLSGDIVQVGAQAQKFTASLDSDAAGLGYMQMHRALRTSPSDNDPVIANNPMVRCICTSNEIGWEDMPGRISNFQFEFEEDLGQ